MTKGEFKNYMREILKEMLFEEGFLSTIISEVVKGIGANAGIVPANGNAEVASNDGVRNFINEMKAEKDGFMVRENAPEPQFKSKDGTTAPKTALELYEESHGSGAGVDLNLVTQFLSKGQNQIWAKAAGTKK